MLHLSSMWHCTVRSSSHRGLVGCCWPLLGKVTGRRGAAEGGESKATFTPAAVRALALHGWERQGLERDSSAASQALLITRERKAISFIPPLTAASLREGEKMEALSIKHYF